MFGGPSLRYSCGLRFLSKAWCKEANISKCFSMRKQKGCQKTTFSAAYACHRSDDALYRIIRTFRIFLCGVSLSLVPLKYLPVTGSVTVWQCYGYSSTALYLRQSLLHTPSTCLPYIVDFHDSLRTIMRRFIYVRPTPIYTDNSSE